MLQRQVINWLECVAQQEEEAKFEHLNFVLCSDSCLHEKEKETP